MPDRRWPNPPPERLQNFVSALRLRFALPALLPVVVLGFFVIRGCGGADVDLPDAPAGAPPPTTAPADTTTTIDLSNVVLAAVPGTTTTAPPVTTGTAILRGTVVGGGGVVEGATVRIERLLIDQVIVTDVHVGVGGTWEIEGIPGGRYRVRAFLPPNAAQIEPELFFLADGDEKRLNLALQVFDAAGVAVAVAPNPPRVDELLNLVVQVTRQEVGSDGVIRPQVLAGQTVDLTSSGAWRSQSETSGVTDGNGEVTFLLECSSAGPNQVSVSVRASAENPGIFKTLEVPECVRPAPPETTPPDPSTPTSPTTTSRFTPTTRPTSTTAP